MMNRTEGAVLRRTRSVCPVCLAPAEALLVDCGDAVYLCKTCAEHGRFETPVWRNRLDFSSWRAGAEPLAEDAGRGCPANCGICAEHEQGTCCALLEVTGRCNLRCGFCFANGGERADHPALDELKRAVRLILETRGHPLLQLSGGEPTLRDDLPALIEFAKANGCPYVQLNSNGIRLAEDRDYVRRLAQAGLSFVFMQFDGVDDGVYRALRGQALLQTKLRAIEVCAEFGLGVTLVPTVVRGVNEHQLGEIVRFGASRSPAVRGVHFQPVSYFGRIPATPDADARYTLDELIDDLCAQTGLAVNDLLPSRCDHPMCGFHGSFLANPDGGLTPLSRARQPGPARTTAVQNREYVARHWQRQDAASPALDARNTSGEAHSSPNSVATCDHGPAGCSCAKSAGNPVLSSGQNRAGCSFSASSALGGAPAPSDCAAASGKDSPVCSCTESAGNLVSSSGPDTAVCSCAESRAAASAEASGPSRFAECGRSEEIPDMETFLRRIRTNGFTLSAMAFQDAMNLDIERLRRCSLHVYDNGKIKPFCAKYLTPVKP